MGHIAQFRVQNPHQWPLIDRRQKLVSNKLHKGSLNQRHMPKQSQIIKTFILGES